jgi:hypothetical protein
VATRPKKSVRPTPTIVTMCGPSNGTGVTPLANRQPDWRIGLFGGRGEDEPAGADRATDRQPEPVPAHQQEPEHTAQQEQSELHPASGEPQRGQVGAGWARPVELDVCSVDRDQRSDHGGDRGHRPEGGDPRVEPGAAVVTGARQRHQQRQQPEPSGGDEPPVADVAGSLACGVDDDLCLA